MALTIDIINQVLTDRGYYDIIINSHKEVTKTSEFVTVSYKWNLNGWKKTVTNQELLFYFDIILDKWKCL